MSSASSLFAGFAAVRCRAGNAVRSTIAMLSGALLLSLSSGVATAGELRLAVSKGPVSLPIYVAEAKGYFQRERVAVRMHECSSGRQCFQRLSQGDADVATAAELMMTLNSLVGSDAAIVATISSSAHHIKLVARGGGGIKSPADLRGRRIATVQGTSAQYFLDSWLVFHDIDPKAVSVVFLATDQLLGALTRREVDAVAIWEPIASSAVAALGEASQTFPSPRVYTQHFSLMASRSTITQREGDLVKLLRALSSAERFIAEQPAEARKILHMKMQGETGLDDMAGLDFNLTLTQSLIATMDGQARWAVRQGLALEGQGSGNLLRSIDAASLRKAVPGAVSLAP